MVNEISVWDVLQLSVGDIVERLKNETQRGGNGQYTILELTGDVSHLDVGQKRDVDNKLRDAVRLFQESKATVSQPVNADALTSRLGALDMEADRLAVLDNTKNKTFEGHDGDSDNDEEATSNVTTAGTTTPTEDQAAVQHAAAVKATYDELVRLDGRPVCTPEQWRAVTLGDAVPELDGIDLTMWLSDRVPFGKDPPLAKVNIFTEQLRSCWAFRRYQAARRDAPKDGVDDTNVNTNTNTVGPFAEYVAFRAAEYKRTGVGHMAQQVRFISNMQHAWTRLPDPRVPLPIVVTATAGTAADGDKDGDAHASSDVPFEVYAEQTAARLVSYYFRKPLALHKDPRQQSPLTTWLEYLVFELDCLAPYLRARAQQAPQYNRAWEALISASRVPMDIEQDHSKAASDSFKEKKAIQDFIQQTALYRHLDGIVRRQQARLQWIASEARAMDAEEDKASYVVITPPKPRDGGGLLATPSEQPADKVEKVVKDKSGTLLWRACTYFFSNKARQ